MKIAEAKKITGGLSKPVKMPGPAYNLPAYKCITGAKLAKVPGSVCAGCYALKGRYRFSNVRDALDRRLASLQHPQWVDAMVTLIGKQPYFRWHDSGDIQSAWHLKQIFEVCVRTPGTRHWLPTREVKFLKLLDPEAVPGNLTIRISTYDRPAASQVLAVDVNSGQLRRYVSCSTEWKQMRTVSRMLGQEGPEHTIS